MAWNDRLLQATYVSPSGIPFNFSYEDVSMTSEKKTSEFIFPEVNGSYIQDLGRAGRSFPFTVFFSGSDYDLVSDSFMSALEEKGIGTLIHPIYGVRFVVPTGSITRNDALLSESNQAVFNVTFSETIIGSLFPQNTEDILSKIKSYISIFIQASSLQFNDNVVLDITSEILSVSQKLTDQILSATLSLESIVKINEEISAAFQIVKNSIPDTISNITENPEIAIQQLFTMLRIPSEVTDMMNEKYTAYTSLINPVLNQEEYQPLISSNNPNNLFLNDLLFVFGSFAFLNESVLTVNFKTRNEVIALSENLLTVFDNIKIWMDQNISSLNYVDTGESYESILNIIQSIASYLINIAFDLPAEKRIILGEDRNIIELVSELYGDLTQIDYFIQTNDLTCDEIEILKQGKEVIYYA